MNATRTDRSILDSRDLIAEVDDYVADREPMHIDDRARLKAILALADEGIEDWEYGATLIHEDYFTEYARELADDIGAVDRDASWPNTYIDWDRAADALKQDYALISFEAENYYVR